MRGPHAMERPLPFDPDAAAAAGSGIYGLPFRAEDAHVVIVPVPFEATTSYGGGASEGPAAVFEASKQVDLFDLELGAFHEAGIHMLPEPRQLRRWNDEAKKAAAPVIEAGGATTPALRKKLALVNDRSEKVNAWVRETAGSWIRKGKLVGVVGGDHAVPLGAIQAAAEKWPGLGVLHLDAHADLRDAYEGFTYSHASIMHNVCERAPGVAKLVQVGLRDVGRQEHRYREASGGRIVWHTAPALHAQLHDGAPWSKLVQRIVKDLPRRVWLSFDIDGLEPSLCPHTGTPVPGGLDFMQAVALVAGVVKSGRTIVGLDLCEVAPGPDGDEWDGNVGARLLYKMIGWALASQRKR